MAATASENRRSSRFAVVCLGLALVGAAAMVYYHVGLFMPRVNRASVAKHLAGEYKFGNDFYPIWLTSRRWIRDGLDPYGPALTREIQIGLLGRSLDSHLPNDPPSDYRRFAYPAFTDLLFWPLSEIPFRILRIAWVALLAGLLATTVVFWARALSWPLRGNWLIVAILLTLCSYPELEGLYAGQLGVFVGFLLAASLLALVRNRLVLAGTLMALATIKPQIVLLTIVYLFFWCVNDWRLRSRFMIGFLATMSVLLAASFVVLPHWVQSWVSVIQGYPRYSTPPLARELLGSTLGTHFGVYVIALLLLAALWLAWRGRTAAVGSEQFWLTLSILLAITTITLLPGTAVFDHVILLPGIFLLASRKQPRSSNPIFQALLAIGFAVLLWPWLAAVGLIAVRPFLRQELFYSQAVFALPLRTAVAFPFIVLGSLALALRRAQPDCPSES
jgi:hypothetical protein